MSWLGVIGLLALVSGVLGCRLWLRQKAGQQGELARQLTERTRELAALNTVATVVGRSLELDEILVGALETTLEVMGVEAGGVYLLDERAGVLKLAARCGLSDDFVRGIDELQRGEGFSGQVMRSGEALVVGDLASDPQLTRDVVRREGLRSLIVVPLRSKDQVLGTLFIITRQERKFSQQDVPLLESIAQQVGLAVDNARLFDTVQLRAEQFRVIHELSRSVSSILLVDELLQQMVGLIRQAFDYYLVEVALVEGDELVFRAGAGGVWGDHFSSFRVQIGAEGITGLVAMTGESLLVPDVRQEPRYARKSAVDTRSELVVPIKVQERVIGLLNVESDRLAGFDESNLAVLQLLANQAGVAIQNARFFEAAQRRAEQFRVVTELGRQITSMLDIEEALERLVRLIGEAFQYYHVGIGLIEGDEVVYRYGAGELWDHAPFEFRPARLKVGREGLTGWVAGSGDPLIVPDVSREPRYVWMEGSKTRSELIVPIRTKGEIFGVLDVQSDRLDAFDESDVVTMQSLANQAAVAIQNAWLYEQAQQAAVLEERQRLARELHDAVTQTLFSASLIAEALPTSWKRDVREGEALLGELRQLSRGALAEMRTLLLELRPAALVEARLADLLRQLADAIAGREGLPVAVMVEEVCLMPPDVHVAFYRTAQEALNNVVKHARASQVEVSLRCVNGPGVELVVRDDGRGFDPERVTAEGLGLDIMRERAQAIGARLEIDSEAGSGTRVWLVWEAQEGE